jgi:splicing factor 3B subunit 3
MLAYNQNRIFRIESLTTNIIKKSIDLAHTPRKFARHPQMPLFCVIEADSNTPSNAVCEQLRKSNQVNDHTTTNGNIRTPEAPVVNGDTAEMGDTNLDVKQFGLPKLDNYWASCIQIVDGYKQEIIYTLELDNNEVALSVACVPFDNQDGEVFLVIGTAKDLTLLPKAWSEAWIHVYRFEWDDSGACKLLLIHKTLVHGETKPDGKTLQKAEYGLPTALIGFQGRLLAGIGTNLLIYDLGMKQLLRKSQQLNAVANQITGLQTQGSRIVASDVQESLTYVVYRGAENRLVPFCDDTIARWTTASAMLDYHSSAGGDKFGNIWAVRCPQDVSEQADEEASGAHLIFSRPYLHSTPNRFELVLHFYPGDVPTSMQRTALVNAGKDVLFWTGLQGTVGVLVPFESREDVTFFSTLEMEMRKEEPPLTGRDHLVYRGYYVPVKGVIDGDLVERFLRLPREGRERIAGELDRSVREVERKIGDMRTRAAF